VCGLHATGVAVLTETEQVAPQEAGARILDSTDAPLLQAGWQVVKLSGVEVNRVRALPAGLIA
jgi:hypothetical protein